MGILRFKLGTLQKECGNWRGKFGNALELHKMDIIKSAKQSIEIEALHELYSTPPTIVASQTGTPAPPSHAPSQFDSANKEELLQKIKELRKEMHAKHLRWAGEKVRLFFLQKW